MPARYTDLLGRLRQVATFGSIAEQLAWDQETMMPPKAARFRAEELATISSLAHERAIDARVGELLAECEANDELTADPHVAANLREMRRDYERARKLPPDLVAEMSETSSLALEAWKTARAESDFTQFEPWLVKQLALNRRKADCYGAPEGGEPYDALVEDFEPGMTSAKLEMLFSPLREQLKPLIAELTSGGTEPGPLEKLELPLDVQRAFNDYVLGQLGFDLDAGRLDVSTHPFSVGLAPGDTRITTRYRADGFLDALGSTMHEAGHGLYEQGLPKEERHGQPLAEALSLGIHESQSRMWENQVGRSRAFWAWALPEAKRIFGAPLASYDVDDVYRAVNSVRPNLIRVESDEVTYNLHIMLRFDLERAMIRGDLAPKDLPAVWNERIKSDLGLDVPDDRRGCLQDVHWSMGSIGYFPTYTLGNLYAAQLWEAAREAMPNLDGRIERGEFGKLLGWLRKEIHAHGRRFTADELCRRVTGRALDHQPLVGYLKTKLTAIHG
jgi:carboxypeptidase Taq